MSNTKNIKVLEKKRKFIEGITVIKPKLHNREMLGDKFNEFDLLDNTTTHDFNELFPKSPLNELYEGIKLGGIVSTTGGLKRILHTNKGVIEHNFKQTRGCPLAHNTGSNRYTYVEKDSTGSTVIELDSLTKVSKHLKISNVTMVKWLKEKANNESK